jgi:hypothetical protein
LCLIEICDMIRGAEYAESVFLLKIKHSYIIQYFGAFCNDYTYFFLRFCEVSFLLHKIRMLNQAELHKTPIKEERT